MALAVTSYAYQYNQASQRTNATWADGSRWQYQYDDLDQVTSGKHYWPSGGEAVGGQQYEYTHDDIGNRKSTAVGGNPLRQSAYTVNAANQYSSRTVPNKVDITGEAHASATVTINDQPTTRHGTYFHGELQIDNTADAAYQAVTNMAILNQTASDLMSTNVGYVFVPKNPEAFQYDADGNLTSDGRWTYFWDAENRLIMMKAIKSNLPDTAWKRLEFAYDYQGRRIQKRVFTQLEGGTAVLDLKFFYDGWNLLAEVNTANQVVRSYVWGLDLSGSVQGAGGVGGLLMVKEGSGGGHFVGYDGNGNVVTLVHAGSGTVSARYEYGPFGEPIRATGPMAKANPFRFSTKYTDNESDLVYYGFRYYNPSTGRWPSRDAIGEAGGINIYAFCGNNPVSRIDTDGRFVTVFGNNPVANYIVKYPPTPTMPFAFGRSVLTRFDDTSDFATTYNDTEWYNNNRPGNLAVAFSYFKEKINAQRDALCAGKALGPITEWTMRGGTESLYGDPDQNWLQYSAFIGDLDFYFIEFTKIKRDGNKLTWTARIDAVDKYGAQKNAPYFAGYLKMFYPLYWTVAGPERKVRVGSWEISDSVECPCEKSSRP